MPGRHTREEPHAEQRARQDRRLAVLRRRIAVAASLSFAALFGLAAQHAVGTPKHAATRLDRRTAAAAPSPRFFDEQADDFAFADETPAADATAPPAHQSPAQAPAPSPPAAQTSVS